MSPQVETIQIPDGYRIERRPVRSPRADERPTIRDERGRVLAVIEQWIEN